MKIILTSGFCVCRPDPTSTLAEWWLCVCERENVRLAAGKYFFKVSPAYYYK